MLNTKICKKCNQEHDIIFFNRNKNNKDGRHTLCKICHNEQTMSYYRTKIGLITKIYNFQKYKSKKRKHNPPDYTKEWLINWFNNQEKFEIMYKRWVESGYNKSLTPSVDRIDNNIGYNKDNIQLMEWRENDDKGHLDAKVGKLIYTHKAVMQYDKNGNFIKEYFSISEACRSTGAHISNISACCKGRIKSSLGYVWRFKNV